ncbi:MAG: hypothetical protein BMS9Abin23_0439 [Thermodesulfobacteriota bacterium]|nr:MAG: hypothetical protein BMS9Abin23_0439 [Thermodesulfobacteriota bacterium]
MNSRQESEKCSFSHGVETREKMRILIFFNHQLSAEILSGGEKMFLDVSRRFNGFGVETFCVVPEISVETLRDEGLDAEFFVTPCFSFEKKSYRETFFDMLKMGFVLAYRTLYAVPRIFRWLRISGADCIYSTGDFVPDTLAPVIAKFFGKRVKWVVLIHHIIESPFKRKTGGFVSNTGSFLMQRFSFRMIRRYADGVFIKNRGVEEALYVLGFKREKLMVIDNGIDLEKIDDMPGTYPEPFDASYIGRLSASKGVTDLIEIWAMVVGVVPSAKLAIIGGGSRVLEEEKKRFIRERKLDKNIKILGSLPDEEAYRVRKTSKISVSCSYEEGWGITIAESLACGVPCVVYDLPVYREKFEGALETVPRGDLGAFTDRVVSLLRDPAKRSSMGAYGRELVKKYDISKVVKREVECMQKI